jgi:hypothetical protein
LEQTRALFHACSLPLSTFHGLPVSCSNDTLRRLGGILAIDELIDVRVGVGDGSPWQGMPGDA